MIFLSLSSYAALLDPQAPGVAGQTLDRSYETLVDAMYANGKVVSTIGTDKMWVPWFKTSSSCQVSDLQSGNACNAGTIDFAHNCMVTDEFSQVGILVAMGKDEQRMTQFANTARSIKSTFGSLPAWRVYRDGDRIEACKQGINGNCDTASDASARIIIALYTASANPAFSTQARTQYKEFANTLAADMLTHEIRKECKPSSLGQGDICYWLAAGSHAQRGGLGTSDFAYTGYYADAIIAMLQAGAQTGNAEYYRVAEHLTLNYLQASAWDGKTFSVPPGRSFKWTNLEGVPKAECSQSCGPAVWDDADAPRAFGMCQANYYAKAMGRTLPGLDAYCAQWGNEHMKSATSAPVQYYTDGSARPAQSGYFAQGLGALFQMGGPNQALFAPTLASALAHYSPSKGTWDNSACFGVYTQAFPMRALGVGLGRDLASFGPGISVPTPTPVPVPTPTAPTPTAPTAPTGSGSTSGGTTCTATGGKAIGELAHRCTLSSGTCTKKSDVTIGTCRQIVFGTQAGDIKVLACGKDGGTVELYRQAMPSSLAFQLCLDAGCVDRNQGFARFVPQGVSYSCTAPTPSPSPTPTPVPTPVPGPQAPQGLTGVASLSATCASGGSACVKASDVTIGTCRTLVYMTRSASALKVLACEKDAGHVELYLQVAPSEPFQACVGGGCVDSTSGFARFLPGAVRLAADETPAATQEPPQGEPAAGPAPEEQVWTVGAFIPTCEVDGVACQQVSDVTDGACRTVLSLSPRGPVKILGCEKEGGELEIYRQQYPEGSDFMACLGSTCVDEVQGFARG